MRTITLVAFWVGGLTCVALLMGAWGEAGQDTVEERALGAPVESSAADSVDLSSSTGEADDSPTKEGAVEKETEPTGDSVLAASATLRSQGLAAEAVTLLFEAFEDAQGDRPVEARLASEIAALLSVDLGLGAQAVDWYERALTAGADPTLAHALVALYLKEGLIERGREFLKSLTSDSAAYALARLELQAGNHSAAEWIAVGLIARRSLSEDFLLHAEALIRGARSIEACDSVELALRYREVSEPPAWSTATDALIAKELARCLAANGMADKAGELLLERTLKNVGEPPF